MCVNKPTYATAASDRSMRTNLQGVILFVSMYDINYEHGEL